MAEHQAQQHAQTGVPRSDSTTTVMTIMTQPVQVTPPQTIQTNENNEKGGWMNTQVGVIDAPTAGVSFSQTHAHIREWILLDSQSSVDYFTNPSLVKDIHDSKECLMLSTNAGQSMTTQKANVPKWGRSMV